MDLELFEGIKIKEIDDSQEDGDFIYLPSEEDEENAEHLENFGSSENAGSQNMNLEEETEKEKTNEQQDELIYEEIDKIIQINNPTENDDIQIKEEDSEDQDLIETQIFHFENTQEQAENFEGIENIVSHPASPQTIIIEPPIEEESCDSDIEDTENIDSQEIANFLENTKADDMDEKESDNEAEECLDKADSIKAEKGDSESEEVENSDTDSQKTLLFNNTESENDSVMNDVEKMEVDKNDEVNMDRETAAQSIEEVPVDSVKILEEVPADSVKILEEVPVTVNTEKIEDPVPVNTEKIEEKISENIEQSQEAAAQSIEEDLVNTEHSKDPGTSNTEKTKDPVAVYEDGFLDDHAYSQNQVIDLSNDDSNDIQIFTEIKDQISQDSENNISVVSRFSQMIIENYEKSCSDKNLIKCLKNFANFNEAKIKVEIKEENLEENSQRSEEKVDSDMDKPQFELISEETNISNVIIENPEIDPNFEIGDNECENLVLEESQKDNVEEEKEEEEEEEEEANVSDDFPLLSEIKMEIEPEKILENIFEESNKEPGQNDIDDTTTNIDSSPEEETALNKNISDIEMEDQEMANSEANAMLVDILDKTMEEIERKEKEKAEIENDSASNDRVNEVLNNFDIANLNEMDVSVNLEIESTEIELKPHQIEIKNKLNQFKDFSQNFIDEMDKVNSNLSALVDSEETDKTIKNYFGKFRDLLIKLNLKKVRRKEIEKIKNALINESESSANNSSCEESESDYDQELNLNRELQSKPPSPSTSAAAKVEQDQSRISDNEKVETSTMNFNEEKEEDKGESSDGVLDSDEEDSSDTDKEIDRLINLSNLNKIKPSTIAKYSTKKKNKKKKKEKSENTVDQSLNASSSSDDTDNGEEISEDQYLQQMNENAKMSLLQGSSEESDVDSEFNDFDDDNNEEDNLSSDTDSIFMRKLESLDKEEDDRNDKMKDPKSRGKDIYERDDDMEVLTSSGINNNEDPNDTSGKQQTSKIDETNDNQPETSIKDSLNDLEKDKNGNHMEQIVNEDSTKIDKTTEKVKDSRPKTDATEREIFSKRLLQDDEDEDGEGSADKSTYKPKKKDEKSKPENGKDDDSSDLEVLDISMFEKKRTYKGTSIEEYFAKRDIQSTKTTTATSSKTIEKSINPDEDLISLSSDSEDESVSSATVQSVGSNTQKKRGPRQMLTQDQLTEETKKAQKDENERVRRLEKKTEMLSQVFSESPPAISQEESSLILDFDKKRNHPISVHPYLLKLLKQHQVEGIKFMYDTVFGSINDMQKGFEGSGCILAHCMGLGKTLQLIALLHTMIRYPQLKINKVLVICPKSTVMNWRDEIIKWLEHIKNGPRLKIFLFRDIDNVEGKARIIDEWHQSNSSRAGCLLLGYEAFKTIVCFDGTTNSRKQVPLPEAKIEKLKKSIDKLLYPDLVVCDEGHIIKNSKSMINLAVSKIETRRRIVLTGTPIQNNLKEYYCMVNFIKPSFLGTEKEFNNLYANPIKSGQHKDSTDREIKFMKQRSYVLNKKLSKFVQRKEAAVLQEFLPEKYEYCLFIPLTPVQERLYEFFLENNPLKELHGGKSLLPDYTLLRKIWTHPKVLENAWEKARQQQKRKQKDTYDSDNDSGDEIYDTQSGELSVSNDWWRRHLDYRDLESLLPSNKLILMFEILKMCQERGEKCLIFSAFVTVLNVVEFFMRQINAQASNPNAEFFGLSKFKGQVWEPAKDYLRLDGKTSKTRRHEMVTMFNNTHDKRMRCFLISSKAGGQGINLYGANRCIILDTSWNPASDQQNIFRIYRLGQPKKCYVYRLLASGTMEEKIYSRSVTKQAMSFRVVDKQQIDRHYNMAELGELYTLTKPDYNQRPTPTLPQDELLRKLLFAYPDKIYKYHEHDSLLENKADEELSEAEKQEAWKLYESDEQMSKRNSLYSSVYPSFNDFTNPLLNDLGFGLPQMQQHPFQMPQFNYPNFQNPNAYDSNLFGPMASMFGGQRSNNITNMGINYGRSILPDYGHPSSYDLSMLSNMVNSTTSIPQSSGATTPSSSTLTSNANALLRSQLNSHLAIGNLNYPIPNPTMSGGGIINPQYRSDLASGGAQTNRNLSSTNYHTDVISSSSTNSNFRKDVPSLYNNNSALSNFIAIDNYPSPGRRSNELSNSGFDPLHTSPTVSSLVPSTSSNSTVKLPTSKPSNVSTSSISSNTLDLNNRLSDGMNRPNISIKTPKRINETTGNKISTTVTKGLIPASIISKNPTATTTSSMPSKSSQMNTSGNLSVNQSISKTTATSSKNLGMNTLKYSSANSSRNSSAVPTNLSLNQNSFPRHLPSSSAQKNNSTPNSSRNLVANQQSQSIKVSSNPNGTSSKSMISAPSSLSHLIKNVSGSNISNIKSGIKRTSSGIVASSRSSAMSASSIINQNKNSGIVISNVSSTNPNLLHQKKPLVPSQIQKKVVINPNLQKIGISSSSNSSIRQNPHLISKPPTSHGINRPGQMKLIPVSTQQKNQQQQIQNALKIQSIHSNQTETSKSAASAAAIARVREMARSGKIQILQKSKTGIPGNTSTSTATPGTSTSSGITAIRSKTSLDITRLAKNNSLSISEVKNRSPIVSGQAANNLNLKRAMENTSISVVPAKKPRINTINTGMVSIPPVEVLEID